MSDEAIKAALDAAALAVLDSTERHRLSALYGGRLQHHHLMAAVTPIAAFLRALPSASVMLAQHNKNQWHSTKTLAAAVEKAARDAR